MDVTVIKDKIDDMKARRTAIVTVYIEWLKTGPLKGCLNIETTKKGDLVLWVSPVKGTPYRFRNRVKAYSNLWNEKNNDMANALDSLDDELNQLIESMTPLSLDDMEQLIGLGLVQEVSFNHDQTPCLNDAEDQDVFM